MKKKRRSVSYAKWGYIFILPFFLCFFIFSLIPLVDTIRYSFFEYYRSGIKEIGPNFVGMQNYISLLGSDMLKYAGNTLILWVIGFIPQIVVGIRNAVLCDVLDKWSDQFNPDIFGMDQRTDRLPGLCIWDKITGRPDELPDVVW